MWGRGVCHRGELLATALFAKLVQLLDTCADTQDVGEEDLFAVTTVCFDDEVARTKSKQ